MNVQWAAFIVQRHRDSFFDPIANVQVDKDVFDACVASDWYFMASRSKHLNQWAKDNDTDCSSFISVHVVGF